MAKATRQLAWLSAWTISILWSGGELKAQDGALAHLDRLAQAVDYFASMGDAMDPFQAQDNLLDYIDAVNAATSGATGAAFLSVRRQIEQWPGYSSSPDRSGQTTSPSASSLQEIFPALRASIERARETISGIGPSALEDALYELEQAVTSFVHPVTREHYVEPQDVSYALALLSALIDQVNRASQGRSEPYFFEAKRLINQWIGSPTGAVMPDAVHGILAMVSEGIRVTRERLSSQPVWTPTTFRRGDANQDSSVDLSDAVTVLGFLFGGTATLACEDAADTNDSGNLGIDDAVQTLGVIFGGNVQPAGFGVCGVDRTPLDGLSCSAYQGGCK